ncbi:peptidoglycan-binding domain-containing protein [Reyranella sp.]|uniref:peptidoglycan-binding domain-containing protein n=1 Tax=Reyranella sp. TaxID=1929291 RepID=UPI003D12A41C
MRGWLLAGLLALTPAVAFTQSASEVERCFQNPASCASSGGAPAPAPAPAPAASAAPAGPARGPDYAAVLNSPEPDRRKLQESLRTLDKYSGPIDGNLQSAATTKAIGDWQKGHGLAATGKLTPSEAVALNNEATKAPIRRLDPSAQVAAAPAAPPSNADALKSLRARLAERRKAAEPKAVAAAQSLVADLKAYVAADGKGAAGEQFAAFAKWYADTKAAGRTVGDIKPAVEDYGDAKAGVAATAEVSFETKQGDKSTSQCLVFAWIEASPRKNAQVFSCDDVAAVERWKTDQALRSAWR